MIGYLIVSNGFLFFAGALQIAMFLGVSAAILVEETNAAIALPAGIAAVMGAIAPPRLVFDAHGTGVWLTLVLVSAAAAYGVRELRDRWPAYDATIVRSAAGLLVLLLLANFWLPLVVAGIHPLVGYGPLPASAIRPVPAAGAYLTDDELYRRFFHLLHQGQGHYDAFRDAWLGLRIRGDLPASVTAYRLPTYYLLWRLVPADAFLIVPLFLVFASIGGVAAAVLAATLGGVACAPLAAAAVLTYAMGLATSVYVTYIDLPAASLALAGLATVVIGYCRNRSGVVVAGIAILTIAALTREILAYVLCLGAVSALATGGADRWRAARAWIAGLVVFGLGYALHAWQVAVHMPTRTGHLDYSRGGVGFALTAISLFGDVFSGTNVLLVLLFGAGVAGVWRATRRDGQPTPDGWPMLRILLASVIVMPLVGMLVVGNPSHDLHGGLVNYWGPLFVPLALACWPLACWPASLGREI